MAKEAEPAAAGDLKDDLTRIQADLAALAQTVRALVGDQAEEGVAQAREAASKIKSQASATAARVEQEVTNRPLVSLLVAFGAGLLVGKLLDRR